MHDKFCFASTSIRRLMNALQNLMLMNSSMKITSSHLSRQVKWSQNVKIGGLKKRVIGTFSCTYEYPF